MELFNKVINTLDNGYNTYSGYRCILVLPLGRA